MNKIKAFDTDNRLINTFAERLVKLIAESPKYAIADTNAKGISLNSTINLIRVEAGAEQYQQPANEVRKFLTLSTAHVSQTARHWMEAHAHANALQTPGTPCYAVAAFMHGWMMRTPPEEMLTEEDIPFDLHVVCTFARQIGCSYILFDGAGEIDETLPMFQEDEDSTDGLTEQEKAVLVEAGVILREERTSPEGQPSTAETFFPGASFITDPKEFKRMQEAYAKPAEAEERKRVQEQELQEIADGAYGDGPFTRGAAKRLLEQGVPTDHQDAIHPEGGLHDELDAPGELSGTNPKTMIPDELHGAIHPEDGSPMHVIPLDTPVHFTESGKRKLDAAGHAVVGRAALAELRAAYAAIATDIDAEIEQRQHGGNDEDWKPLQDKATRLAEAMKALDI